MILYIRRVVFVFRLTIMSDWPWQADKTALLNQKAHFEKLIYTFGILRLDYIYCDFIGLLLNKAALEDGLDKVTVQLDLLRRKVELYQMTTQLDQFGTDVPLVLDILNVFVKNELDQVTTKLSELGPLYPDPGPVKSEVVMAALNALSVEFWGGLPFVVICIFLFELFFNESISDNISLIIAYIANN